MPHDKVALTAVQRPDIGAYRTGNCGIDYVHSFDSGRAGPHVVLNALAHGNEFCGAMALTRLLEMAIRPSQGRLTLVFANVEAYLSFDPDDPFAARYLDEDFNRLWRDGIIDAPLGIEERLRAGVLRPLYRRADVLLDLHSMARDTVPLLLCGATPRGRELARRLGYPIWVVADPGHRAGPRLIDYQPFADPKGHQTAILAECGQHWRGESGVTAFETCLRLLLLYGMIHPDRAFPLLTPRENRPVRVVEVTAAVTARSHYFAFTDDYAGMTIIPRAGTVIGNDGYAPIVTPYDDCVLVMPTQHAHAGQTIVRLGRIVA